MRNPSGFPPVQTDALTVVLLSSYTLNVRESSFTFSPISSSTGIYGMGGFLKIPRSTSFSRRPFGTLFWSDMALNACRNIGFLRSFPKELLGTVSAKTWYCRNWLRYGLLEGHVSWIFLWCVGNDDFWILFAVNGGHANGEFRRCRVCLGDVKSAINW